MKQIEESKWEDIQRKLSKLEALEAGGVDSWEWYSKALEEWFKDNEVDELCNGFLGDLEDILTEADVDEPAGRGCGYSISFDKVSVKTLLLKFASEYKEILRD